MVTAYQKQHGSLLAGILKTLPKSASDLERHFTEQFFAKMLVADLEKVDPKQGIAVALSCFQFIKIRDLTTPKIRVFSPTLAEQGYVTKSLVVELLNDDMPFLVDSLTLELTRHGLSIREIYHPIVSVTRDESGTLQSVGQKNDTLVESLIHFEISPLPEGLTASQLTNDLEWVLTHVKAAVTDWKAIENKVEENIKNFTKLPKNIDKTSIAEGKDFLHWLKDRNFVFLGYAEYDFTKDKESLAIAADSKLGILRIGGAETPAGLEYMPEQFRHFLLRPTLIEITKSNRRSAVHRAVLMDYVAVKRFDDTGNVIGEARFLGLFTSNVYYQSAREIPLVRSRIMQILERSVFNHASHDGKSLMAILEFMPRDEIFQMTDDELFEISMGILALESKPAVRVFVRKDAFERFISVMVFVPRERFSTELRKQIQIVVEASYHGTVSTFNTQIYEAPLARLHLIIKTEPGEIPTVDLAKLEAEIAKRAYQWSDQLYDALAAKYDEQKALKYHINYVTAFPQGYINRYDAGAAIYDIGKVEEAVAGNRLAVDLFSVKAEAGYVHLKLYNPNQEIALSDILPVLENAGFRVIEEYPFKLEAKSIPVPVWIRDVKLELPNTAMDIDAVKSKLEEALLHIWQNEMENDRFNALVLKAGLDWREVVILRAIAKYLKQISFNVTQATIEQACNANPVIIQDLIAYFHTRFTPDFSQRDVKLHALQSSIEAKLANVENATEDRAIRRLFETMQAIIRTNFYQTLAGMNKPVLSFKIQSGAVPELPLPKPYAEIFVYSPRVEGIHLRGGKVARGGLRWSDRPDDFRTEILGLMKAQMVKNSVIVPVGSKGGFVLKNPPKFGGREALQQEGIACYTLYLQGLLDITDNFSGGTMIPPENVVRHDGDDPYLVVAADKGTASFSDIANGVSKAYGFWLGDAFASGGSAGYDHKEMAITARGAWISVMRHFREMGTDITQTDFTCVGIGDMSGDVFGNGMLLSERIHLLAAFNHLHIFIDPTPDAKTSFAERKRLFELPRSTWEDYTAAFISKGGGIYSRSAKSITLSEQAVKALGLNKNIFSPDELVKALLLAPADLLWNGGIGTYVKAEDETHEHVGDRANNGVRVNGRDLRCKIVGEGGNLGFTQKGRIEYARAGGRINTDAIDNSAGVDCSDHEVNIKIAFSSELAKGALDLEKRDSILESMTDEVAGLVLKDNTLQTGVISLAESQGASLLDSHIRLIHALERKNLLDRTIEFLPGDKQLSELKNARKGLCRPELSVMLAYSKMDLYNQLLASDLPDQSYFISDLKRYFPKAMQESFADAIISHPLRREIIATVVTNSLINRAGATFVNERIEELGVSARDIAVAYALVRDALKLGRWWREIEAMPPEVSVATQMEMLVEINRLLTRLVVWLLRNQPLPLDIAAIEKNYISAFKEIMAGINAMHSDITRKDSDKVEQYWLEKRVPKALAERMGSIEILASSFDLVRIAAESKKPLALVGKAYFEIGKRFYLGWFRKQTSELISNSHWDTLAIQSLSHDVYEEQRRLTASLIAITTAGEPALEQWLSDNEGAASRYDRFLADLRSGGDAMDIAKLMVALRYIRAL